MINKRPFNIGDEVIVMNDIYEDNKLLFREGDKCIIREMDCENQDFFPLVFDPERKTAAFLMKYEYFLIKD